MRRKYIKCTKAAVICMSVMLAFSSAYASDSTAAVETTTSSEINESDNNTTDEKSDIDDTINDETGSITTENKDSDSKIADNDESNNEKSDDIQSENNKSKEQIKSEINQNNDNQNKENAEEKTEANKTDVKENKASENTDDATCKTEKEAEKPSAIVGEGVIDEKFSNTDETDVDDSNIENADTKPNTVREISPETIILPEPTRDGYTFVEQNTRIDGEGTSYQAGDEIEVVPMSLYAIWQENELTE